MTNKELDATLARIEKQLTELQLFIHSLIPDNSPRPGPPYYGPEVFKTTHERVPSPDEIAARQDAYIARYGQP